MGADNAFSWHAALLLVSWLSYFLSPLDLIPESMLGIMGFVFDWHNRASVLVHNRVNVCDLRH